MFEWQDYVQMCVKVSAEVAAVVLQYMEKCLKKNPKSRTDIGIGVSAGSACYSRISSLCIALTSSMSSSEGDGTTDKAECLDNVNDEVARPITPGSARRLYASNLACMAHNLDDNATLDRSRLHERSAIADRTGEGVRCRPLPPERLLPLETGEYNTHLPGSQSSQAMHHSAIKAVTPWMAPTRDLVACKVWDLGSLGAGLLPSRVLRTVAVTTKMMVTMSLFHLKETTME